MKLTEIEKLKAQLEVIQGYFIKASIEEVTKDDLINMMLDDKIYVEKKIKEFDPHEVSSVACDLCKHNWTAVRPEGLNKLECPNCGNICSFENVLK